MNQYPPDSDVTVDIVLTGTDGLPLSPLGVSYSVTDEVGVVVPQTILTGPFTDLTSVSVVVPAASNAIPIGSVASIRRLTAYLSVATGTLFFSYWYMLRRAERLVEWVNSFQTLAEAMLLSSTIVDVADWELADDSQRERALMGAYDGICQLLFYVPEIKATPFFLRDLTEDERALAPNLFLAALSTAQVIEANALLSDKSDEKKRNAGILSETIGESSIRFRSSKAYDLGTDSRTVGILGGYLSWSMKVVRT